MSLRSAKLVNLSFGLRPKLGRQMKLWSLESLICCGRIRSLCHCHVLQRFFLISPKD